MLPSRYGFITVSLVTCATLAKAHDEGADVFEMSLQELMTIPVVSASQSARALNQAAGIVTVITAAQIDAMGARTLTDVLKTLPGMQLQDRRSGLDSVWLRGIVTGRNTKVLLLIDDVPQDEPVFSEWSPDESLPLNMIERIEVIRGPGSALYGGNAYAGVISVYTRAFAPQTSRASVALGSDATKRLQWLTGIDAGETQFITSGSAYDTRGYAMQRDRSGLPSTHDNNVSDFDLHMRLRIGHWEALLAYNDFTTEYPLYSSPQDKQQQYKTSDFALNYKTRWAGTTLAHQLYRHHVTRRYDRRIRNDDGSSSFSSYSDLDSTLYGLRSQLSLPFTAAHKMTAGLNWQSRIVDEFHETITLNNNAPTLEYESLLDDDGDRTPDSTNYAAYLQQESDFFDGALLLTAGLRYDHFQRWGSKTSPRFALTWNPASAWSGKLLWGQAFRPPTLIEQFEVRSDDHSEGNVDLRPELIDTRELEVSYRLGEQSNLSVRTFRSHLTDFIVTIDYQPYENIGSQVIAGQELEWISKYATEWTHMPDLQLNVNLTRIDSDEASVARHMGNVSLSGGNAEYNLSLIANYVGRRNASTTYHTLVTDPVLQATDNKGAYWSLDAAYTLKRLGNTDWRLSLFVHNVFDRQRYDPSSEPDSYYDIRKEPRNIWVQLTRLF